MEKMEMGVGFRLKYIRMRNGETQCALAKVVHISQHIISDWECEKRGIPIWAIRAICKHYNVSADWLLCIDREA